LLLLLLTGITATVVSCLPFGENSLHKIKCDLFKKAMPGEMNDDEPDEDEDPLNYEPFPVSSTPSSTHTVVFPVPDPLYSILRNNIRTQPPEIKFTNC